MCINWFALYITVLKTIAVTILLTCQVPVSYSSGPKPACSLMLPHNFNTLRPRQNGRNFPDYFFKCIFMNESTWISIKISLTFVPGGPVNNSPSLVQIMAWRLSGHRPLSIMACRLTGVKHICVSKLTIIGSDLKQWWLAYWRIYASLGLSELTMRGHQQAQCWLQNQTCLLHGQWLSVIMNGVFD